MTTAARACPACHTPLPEEAHFCLHCGTATPTEPGVPPRTASTDLGEIARVRRALAGRGYMVDRVLGEGGMATVYLATDAKHRRQVAVKVIRPELAATLGVWLRLDPNFAPLEGNSRFEKPLSGGTVA